MNKRNRIIFWERKIIHRRKYLWCCRNHLLKKFIRKIKLSINIFKVKSKIIMNNIDIMARINIFKHINRQIHQYMNYHITKTIVISSISQAKRISIISMMIRTNINKKLSIYKIEDFSKKLLLEFLAQSEGKLGIS